MSTCPAVAAPGRLPGRLPLARLVVTAAAVAAVVASVARWGPDWPAQEFRALVAHTQPLALWANGWFSGQPLAGYSLVFPLLSGVLGAAAVGVLSVIGAAWAAGRLTLRERPGANVVASEVALEGAIVVSLACSLVQGQLPYLLGTAFGLSALAAARSGRPALVAAAAALCGLSSPLAGFFLLLGAGAATAVRPVRDLLPFSAVAAGFIVPLVLGGASGPNPYPLTSLATATGFAAALLAAFRGPSPIARVLRRFAVLYVAAAIALLPVANPVGGNIVRVGTQLALPVACLALRQSAVRRRVLAVVAALAAGWSVWPAGVAVAHGAGDPSQYRAYFTPLLRYLERVRPGTGGRVEIPMTREHWEARWVAAGIPLARGWDRQTDMAYNQVLYEPLSAPEYRRWLDANAVGWVALPDVPLDAGGIPESVLLRRPPSWLEPVWHNAHWRVWRVRGARPIVSLPATLERLGETTVSIRFSRPGSSLVRVRAAPLWRIARGSGCLAASAAGWLRVTGHGRLVLATGLPGSAGPAACRTRENQARGAGRPLHRAPSRFAADRQRAGR